MNARKIQPPSIKATLAGIQFHLRCRDPSSISLFQHPSISLLIKGISKAHPGKKDKRLPITLPLLHKLLHRLRLRVFGSYMDILLDAVLLTAFYGFLRCGEFTYKSLCFDPNHDLTISDILILKHQFTLTHKHSKTDKSDKGIPIIISSINSVFCPLLSMSRYLKTHHHTLPDDPLFITEDGKPLTSSWFASKFKQLCRLCSLDPDMYTPHSIRIGAATSAAPKVPTSTLKEMGRWSSAAYERYIRPNFKDIVDGQKLMSS